MRIGLLTGGGDCPGLNAAIRAVVKHAELGYGHSVVGFRNGWRGVVDGDFAPMTRQDVRSILHIGGTILGTARFHPRKEDGGIEAVLRTMEAENIEALICIGGDGTLKAAGRVAKAGVPIVGIPKTIDNDVAGTELSIGFDTAVTIATEAIDRLHTTAESHNRVMVLEVMGRSAGWIAVSAGIAGGADVILIPEAPFDIEDVAQSLQHRHRSHAKYSIVVVAEGAVPAADTDMVYETVENEQGSIVEGAIGTQIMSQIARRTGFDTRVTVLGHVQRGGSPTPADRILGSKFGVAAVEALSAGQFGVMTGLQAEKVVLVPLEEISGIRRAVPPELVKVATALA